MVQKANILQQLVLTGALLTLAACGGAETAERQESEGPLVEIVEVQPMSAAGAIRASGLVGYKREPQLAFTAPGVVGSLHVEAGDVVRRGQRLAVLRRTSVGSNTNEAALARANAERDLVRAQELFDRGFVSQARLDDARLAVERARDTSVLTAPADGVVLRRLAETSQTVAAGAPIFVFGDTASGLVVRAPVASSEAARVRVGDTANVIVAGGAPLQGRVTRVGAKGADSTGAFEIEVDVASAEGVRSGMVAQVEIAAAPSAMQSAAIMVPTLSLLDSRADQGVVFVVDADNIARRRSVRTSGVTQEGVLVVEGLQAGERVVAAGAAYVRDGASVRTAAGS